MPFFNLTALGLESPFRPQRTYIHLFTSDDVEESFAKRFQRDDGKGKSSKSCITMFSFH